MFASNFRVRTHSIFLTVAMLAALLFAPPSAIAADPVPGADFTLTILHNNDGESQLINAGSGLEDFGGIARFKTLVDGLRADAIANGNGVLMLSSGDNFLAGPEFNASVENGIPYYDALGIEAIGYDAISLGNHDFDFGPDTLANFLSSYSSAPQYLNANLDFSGEPGLQAFADSGVIAPSTVVSTGGEDIGIIGAITPSLRSISSPRGVVIDFDVAGAIQAEIDTLTAAGVNKIVIISHLQSIDEDIALAAQLTGVDVMIAGGGDELLANPGDPLVPGEEDDVFGAYPLTATGGDGASIPIVTTPGEYKYLGQLSVGFDSDGNVVGVGADSGPKVVDGTLTADAAVQAAVVDPVVAALATLDSTVIGTSEVTLDGTRATVRSVESNEGNLIADALWWQATELAADFGVNPPDVALQNGGGIRNNVTIPAGDITLLDTFDSVPFSNFVSIVPDIQRWKFRNILENAVSNVPGDGRFAQVSGFSFTYDSRGIPMNIDDETGEITQLGTRIVDVTLDDGTEIVKDGAVIPGDRINIATIDFLARGGDQYPYVGAPFTSVGVSYQQAMANFIVDGLNGLITAADYPEGGEGRITAIAGMVDGPFTPIYDVQGDSDASPLDGEVVEIEGTVTGVFPDLGGFYLQETVGDGDAATSDGVFVESDEAVAAGTHAAVLGVVEENFGETRVTATAVDTVTNGTALAPTEVTLPLADGASLEAYEGMLITFPEYLFVSDMFNLHRFGETLLAAGGVLVNPTDIAAPGDEATAVAAANTARSIVLDDGSGAQFPDEVPYTVDGQRRRGDAAKDITANLSFSFGAYKLQPTEEVTFVEMNPRPAAPDDVGGNIKVASFNVLNFFSTIDDGVNNARGADSDAEKAAQLTKLVAAINGLDADIIGLQEIENNGPVAIGELVDALNADNGAGTWAAAADPDYPGGLEATNAIKVGIIFKPAVVTPVGGTEVSEDPVFAADRPAIAHSFEANGDTFTVINNHFKSKSSSNAEGPDLDQGDGQGAYNARRTAQAGALLDFTLERIGATGDGDVLVIGDFNSYQNEDPIATLEGAGFLANLVKDRLAPEDSYSLVFFGQQGLLDGAFATSTLDPKVTGIDIWHINADEPRVLQYNDDVVDAGESSSAFNQPLSQPDAYSSSDHDPIVVGLQLGGAESVASGLYNPRHLTMGDDGTVYVAESGVGGAEPCLTGGDGSTECFGLTGAVTAITGAGQERIATGLPSVAADGFAATGPSDVAVAADGTVRALIGLGQNPAVRDEILTPAGGGAFGQIVNIGADGTGTPILDVAAYEGANNPDGGHIDSNPNALIHTDDGYLIADAGANALLKFDGTSLSTVAVFPERVVPAPPFIPDPEIPMQSVPTSVTVGPDGAYYVGELTGFPFPVGGANVYKVDPATGDVSVFADGFTNIVDLEFGPNGDLYVVQISSSSLLVDELDGAVIKVAPDGSRGVFFDDLFAPSGIAINQANGDVYVSNCGICPGFGEVLRINGDFVASPISLGYSASNDRKAPVALDGATVSGKIYPFVEPLDPGLGFTTVDFYLDGEHARTEYLAPYDFAGGLLTMATAFETSQVADGAHTIKASGNLPDGSTVETTATFTVDNAPTMTEDFTVAFSDSEFRTDPAMLEGAFVRGNVYPFVYPLFPEGFESYGRVSFYLDGEAFHTEYQAPYDFVSGGIAKANEVWNTTALEDGVHTITVKAHRDGATPLMTTVTFTVSNDTEPPPPPPPPPPEAVRFATFNASLNRSNAGDLVADLSTPDNEQAKVIAEIIQRTRPEVLLLNEFDYDVDGEGARLFQENYLAVSQNGAEPIVYGYAFSAPSNTGVASGLDLDNSGDVGGPNDAFGFGFFEGQFGMQVYSQYPIDFANVRTFQNFLWADMPTLLPVDPSTGEGWYSEEELESVRLSSKSHWDVPIVVGDSVVNFLVSHPTPPVFDGLEDRNGTRNFAEIQFWRDYADGAPYMYDDNGTFGGWSGDYFVIAGDLNSDPNDGDSLVGSVTQLLDLPRVNTSVTPSSLGAVEQNGLQGGANLTHTGNPAYDTADFNDNPAPGNLRADYVLPSNNLDIVDSGVFWPESTDPLFSLVGTFPFPGSDHRMVWVDLLPGDEPLADSFGPPDDGPVLHFDVTIENLTPGQPLTPVLLVSHDPAISAWTVGEAAPIGVQELAENGNGTPLAGFFTSRLSQTRDGRTGAGPLVPAADPGGSGFPSSETLPLHALADDVVTLGAMLICTNDGFVGLNGAALPGEGETVVYDLVAYDAGTETNTEDFADMVPPCQGLIGVSSDDPGTGATNPDLAEGGVIGAHAGIVGGNDLDPAVHGWTDPVARVTITQSAAPPFELTGEIDGAPYRILAPANQDDWNGVLLAYAHGYQDALDHPSEGTDRGRVDAAPGGAETEAALIAQGFALAGSQYKTDGWAVEDGIADTEALINYFGDNLAPPQATVLWGFSMGSVIAGHAAENSDSVDGVIAACFVGAGAPRAFDASLPLLLAYEAAFGFPEAWGNPGDVRDDLDFDTEVLPVVGSQLFVNPLDPTAGLKPENVGLFTFIQMVSGIPAEDFFTDWLFTDLFFSTEARAEMERRAGGAAAGNVGHVYSLTAEDRAALASLGLDEATVDGLLAAMNSQTYTPDPAARAFLENNYDYTGALDKPVLTIHTTIDGLVPVESESAYAETVNAAGASDWLVQTYTDTYPPGTSSGHCTFTPEQLGASVEAMLGWIFTGTAPGPDAFPEALGFVPDFQPGPWPQPPPAAADVVELQILAINDFHGNIATTSSAFGGVGRADFLAANMAAAEAEAENSIIVSAGDLIGASPLVSALFHDEPTIEAMNLIGLDINGVGNHEFDEGGAELLRMQNGGSHPVDGDLDGDGFAGADFEFLAANVVDDASGDTIFDAYTVKEYEGVKVAFIGMTLEGTPSIVTPAGVAGLTFNDEVDTVNALIPEIQAQGIEAIVVLMHEGGVASEGGGDGDGCGTLSGALYDIVVGLDDAVDLVIGGHNNQRFVCPDVDGKAVTMAYHSGRMFTDIDTVLDKATGEMTIVAIDNKENFQEGVTPDASLTALIDKYETLAAPLANQVVGSITTDILRTNNDAGESALGDVIADAQLAATSSAATGGAVLSFMNPGGIRGDMLFADVGGPLPGEVSFGEAFRIQPFGNSLVTMTLTGAQIHELLTQQWSDPDDPSILQIPNGFTYTWDANEAVADRVDASSMMLNGVMIDPDADYRVTVNSFLADGGDGFSVLTEGTDRLGGEVDLDALVTYFGANSPIAPGPQDRITRVEGEGPAPVSVVLMAALNGANEVPGPGDPNGTGSADITIDGTTLTWDISVALIGDIQAGHIHEGDATVAGPAFINMDLGPVVFVDDGTGTYSAAGSLTITEEQAQAVAADPGGFYLNLHTPQFPGGAIRGQLVEPN